MPELPDLTSSPSSWRPRQRPGRSRRRPPRRRSCLRATPAELAALTGIDAGARRAGAESSWSCPSSATGGRRLLAANPMLAGRFWLMDDGRDRVRARTGLRLRFTDGGELRYVDREMLGKLYLVATRRARHHPRLDARWGPMPTTRSSPSRRFRQRIRRHPGELKPLLRNARFVAGIGNAYSDEILWEARLAPFRRRSPHRSGGRRPPLRVAMRSVLADAIAAPPCPRPAGYPEQHREFLKVHLRGGAPCPRCGRELRQIGGDEATTFCRTCQPPF